MRQPLQQYRRRIPHEYQQLKLRRLGIVKYANGNLRYKPVKLFRHDHCGHPGSAPRGAEIRDEVHKQHRQQQRRKRGDGDHRLLFPVIGIRSIRVYHLRKQQRSQQTGAVFVLQRRKQQGQIQSQRDKHSRLLVAPFPVCQLFHVFRGCVYWRHGLQQLRELLVWLCPRLLCIIRNSSLAPSMGAQAAGGHEMSVPKSRRGESPAEYINLAREIYVFTYNRVRILPKSYTFYFSLPLYNAAREAYRLIKTANLIYIHNDADKQNRKELYERAQGYYNSMLDVLDLAYMNVNHEKLPSNVLKEWVKLITDELAQISKIKRSDKAR
nr:MAG TPA: Avd-like-generating retroelement protein [Caudoviricetes sp.]